MVDASFVRNADFASGGQMVVRCFVLQAPADQVLAELVPWAAGTLGRVFVVAGRDECGATVGTYMGRDRRSF